MYEQSVSHTTHLQKHQIQIGPLRISEFLCQRANRLFGNKFKSLLSTGLWMFSDNFFDCCFKYSYVLDKRSLVLCGYFHGGIFHTVKDKHKDCRGASRGRRKHLNVCSLTQTNSKTGQVTHHVTVWGNFSLWNPLSGKDPRYKTNAKSPFV